jgi:hypothetical protein
MLILRRFQLLAASCLASLLLLYGLYTQIPLQWPTIRSLSSVPQEYTVAITELAGWHDEVVAAVVHSFGSQPSALMSVYQRSTRFGISKIMQAFDLPRTLPASLHPNKFLNPNEPQQTPPDILVSTTCEVDTGRNLKSLDRLFDEAETHLFCVVHHAELWRAGEEYETALGKWGAAGRLTFLTLSPHTADFLLHESLSKWGYVNSSHPADVKSFTPVFPVDVGQVTAAESAHLSFSIQGNYDSSRRNYKAIFTRLEQLIRMLSLKQSNDSSDPTNVSLHLLGNGKHPSVPKAVQENVHFDERLEYLEFYRIMSSSFALVPAFANNDYYDRKASSSVPAALIAGVPVVANQKLLDNYRYLDRDCVWFQEEGETDMDVVSRVALSEGRKERAEKKRLVRTKTEQILKGNTKLVGELVDVALRKAEERKAKKLAEAEPRS